MTKIRTGNPDTSSAGSTRRFTAPATTSDISSLTESIGETTEAQIDVLNVIEHQLTLLVDRVMNSLYPSTLGALRVDISPSASVNANVTNITAIGGLNPSAFMYNMQYQVSYTLRANIVTT